MAMLCTSTITHQTLYYFFISLQQVLLPTNIRFFDCCLSMSTDEGPKLNSTPSPHQNSKGQNFKHSPFPLTLLIALLPPVLKEERKHNTQDNEQTATSDVIQTVQLINLLLTVLFKDWTNSSSF